MNEQPMTVAAALSNAIFLAEESADTDIKVWRNDMLRTVKALKILKQEMEKDSMKSLMERINKIWATGKKVVESPRLPLTFADLKKVEAAQQSALAAMKLSEQFQLLSQNILASDIEDKPAALKALADEYAGLVKNQLAASGKKVFTFGPDEGTKSILDKWKLEKPPVKNFFGEKVQGTSFEDYLANKNGKGVH